MWRRFYLKSLEIVFRCFIRIGSTLFRHRERKYGEMKFRGSSSFLKIAEEAAQLLQTEDPGKWKTIQRVRWEFWGEAAYDWLRFHEFPQELWQCAHDAREDLK